MDIKNAVILVTGANRGIGKAYVDECLKHGAKKIYLGVRKVSSAKRIEKENPGKVVALKLDLTNSLDIQTAAIKAADVTLLISNAGVLAGGNITDDNIVDHARMEMEVNYFGPLALIQAFAPILKANGGGHIVCVDSIAGLMPFPTVATYSASKAAMHFLIMQARTELANQGTKVTGVYPGPIDTDMARNINMPKVPAEYVAVETITALRVGREDVLPDPYAKEAYAVYKNDPKESERRMRAQYKEMSKASAPKESTPKPETNIRSAREAVSVFNDAEGLQAAADELQKNGFAQHELSVLASEKAVEKKLGHLYKRAEETGAAPHTAFIPKKPDGRADGTVTNAPLYIAAATEAGTIVASEGRLLDSIKAAMTDDSVDGTIGTVFGRLIEKHHAGYIQKKIEQGGLLLWVRICSPHMEERARKILGKHASSGVHVHDIALQG